MGLDALYKRIGGRLTVRKRFTRETLRRRIHGTQLATVAVGASLLTLAVASCGTTAATATIKFPTHTIVLISDSAAGSPKDILARKMAATVDAQHPTWHVIVEDKVGGSGAAALQYLTSQPANGYNVLMEPSSFLVEYDTTLHSSFPLSDLNFVAETDEEAFMLAAYPGSGITSLSALAAKAKTSRVTIAGFGQNSQEHLTMAIIAHDLGFKFTWLPYTSGTLAVTAAVGGQADAVMVDASGAAPFVKTGALKGLVVTSSSRLSIAPRVPTGTSLGLAGSVDYIWHGWIVRGGTPLAVRAALDSIVKEMLSSKSYKAYMASQDISPAYLGASAFEAKATSQIASFRRDLPLLSSTSGT